MHDINPLGTVMHLKELDRWAAPKLRPLRSKGERSFRVAALATASVALRPACNRHPVRSAGGATLTTDGRVAGSEVTGLCDPPLLTKTPSSSRA